MKWHNIKRVCPSLRFSWEMAFVLFFVFEIPGKEPSFLVLFLEKRFVRDRANGLLKSATLSSDDVALETILVEQPVPDLDLVLDENLVLVEIAQGLELDFELNTFMGNEDFWTATGRFCSLSSAVLGY